MRKFVICLIGCAVLGVLALPARAAGPDAILGVYWTDDRTGRIEIYRDDARYFGKIVWEEPRDDGRVFVGRVFLEDFVFDGEDRWTGGTVTDPRSGSVYRATMWLDGSALKLRGYIGFSLFGSTRTFPRAE